MAFDRGEMRGPAVRGGEGGPPLAEETVCDRRERGEVVSRVRWASGDLRGEVLSASPSPGNVVTRVRRGDIDEPREEGAASISKLSSIGRGGGVDVLDDLDPLDEEEAARACSSTQTSMSWSIPFDRPPCLVGTVALVIEAEEGSTLDPPRLTASAFDLDTNAANNANSFPSSNR